MHFVLLVRGTAGDFLPFMQIAKGLKARGHHITMMTHAYYTEKVVAAGLEAAPIDHVQDFADLLKQTPTFNTKDFIAGLKQGLPSLLEGYQRYHHLFDGQENTLLVAHHNTHLAAQFISEKHAVGVISIFTAPHFVLNMPFWEQAYTIASETLNEIRAAMDLPAVYDWVSWWRTLQGFIGLWPEWYALADASWPVAVNPAGFILDEPAGQPLPPELEAILRAPTPSVLITHASSATSQSQIFSLSIEACRLLGWQAIVVTPHRQLLPDGLPVDVHYYPALPFRLLLPRLKAVIHHGGIGTLAHALAAGIPQLILGVGYDRPDNGTRAQRLGIGEFIPLAQWRSESIAHALQRLASSPLVERQCKRLAAQVLADTPLEKVCTCLEKAAGVPLMPLARPQTSAGPGPGQKPSPFSGALARLSPEKQALLATKLRQKKTV